MRVVGKVGDFLDSKATRVELDGVAICVVRVGDDFYAVADTCSHAEFSLSEGEVWPDECEIECPKHGAMFSLLTGEPQTLPATQPVDVFDVSVVDDDVCVSAR